MNGVLLDIRISGMKDSILEDIGKEFKENGVNLITRYNEGPVNFIDELYNCVTLILSEPIIQQVIIDVGTNLISDLLKKNILKLINFMSSKKYKKISSNKVEEKDSTFGMQIGNLNYRFPNNISDNLKEKCIEEAFKLAGEEYKKATKIKQFIRYNEQEKLWEVFTQEEYINKIKNNKK